VSVEEEVIEGIEEEGGGLVKVEGGRWKERLELRKSREPRVRESPTRQKFKWF